MQPPHHHSRINLTELKVEMVRKLGPEKSKQYFHFLRSFLSLKLSKVEFNKLCVKILGRENLPLHNLLIRSILKNACSAKIPPQVKEIPSDGYHQNGLQMTPQPPGLPGFANGGDILPVSPKKARTKRSRSALGPNGEANFASQSRDFIVISENGKSMQHHQELTEQEGRVSVHSNDLAELCVRDEEKEFYSRSMVKAPLGIPLCPVSIGGARKARCVSTCNDGALLDNLTLRERMEQIAASQGLQGVSIDCANILNHGLDCYIKNLIRSCFDLMGARLRQKSTKPTSVNMKLINGTRPGYHPQMQDVQEHKAQFPISLQDFRVAMELNPRLLGEDWPLLLEKICTHSFEE